MYSNIKVRIGGGVVEKVGAAKATRIYLCGFYGTCKTHNKKQVRAAADQIVGQDYSITGYYALHSLLNRHIE